MMSLDRLVRAMAEMNAIVAGQIAAGFAGGDHVIRGDSVFGVRQRHIHDRRAHVRYF